VSAVRDATSQDTPASFSEALRQAIAERGVSLEWLRSRLADLGTPLSVATLSYWRSGRSEPEHVTSLEALATLEELLYLPTGYLRSRLRPSRRPGPTGGTKSLAELMGGSPAVRHTLEQLGYDPDEAESMVETSTQVTFDVDEQGRGRSAVSRSVWKAVRDGALGQPFVFRMRGMGDAVPEFIARKGCSIGKTHNDIDAGLFGVEVLLERPLMTGETAISEHQVLVPADAEPQTFYEVYVTRRLTEAVLWVRFDRDRVPVHCEAYTEDLRSRSHQVLRLHGTTSAHHVVRNFGPGKLGIRWRW
jgi:hypothetical protein